MVVALSRGARACVALERRFQCPTVAVFVHSRTSALRGAAKRAVVCKPPCYERRDVIANAFHARPIRKFV